MTRRSQLSVALAAAAATPLALWAVLASNHPIASRYAIASLGLLIGVAFIASGVVARTRRPENRTGLLLIAVGFGFFLSALSQANDPYLFTLGSFVGAVSFGLLIHLVAAFPSGRLESRFALIAAAAGYAIVFGANAASLFFSDLRNTCGDKCPRNVALVYHDEGIAKVLQALFAAGAVALAIALVVMLAQRWRRASPALRRALAPVFLAGAATLSAAAIDLVATTTETGVSASYWLLLSVFLSVPVAFLYGLLRSRLAGAAAGRLLVSQRLSTSPRETELALREALGDPGLRLGFWYERGGFYVAATGEELELDRLDEDRQVTRLEDERGAPLAAVVHDEALVDEPDLLNGVLAAARLGLERDRLYAELQARLGELRQSRSRLVAAADEERRRLERNLHDGAQQRLVSLSLALRLAKAKVLEAPIEARAILDEASTELARALEELRELARGLHPAILTDRGLEAALRALAARSPVPVELRVELEGRPPEQVEVALFYVASESLTNVAKYAQASLAIVRVTGDGRFASVEIHDDGIGGADAGSGTGLRGLADRVEALDGRLAVESRAGAGTTITAVIPTAVAVPA